MWVHIVMVVAMLGALAVPMILGTSPHALIVSHLLILVVCVAIFVGVLRLNRER